MYELRKINEDKYQLHCGLVHEQSVEGTFLAILVYANHRLGFSLDELELAFVDLIGDNDKAFFYGSKKYSHSVVSNRKYKRTG